VFIVGLHRQVLYGGLRIGMYDPLKRAFMGSKAAATDVPGLHIKIAAGMTSGALAILVASPTDLVKVCRSWQQLESSPTVFQPHELYKQLNMQGRSHCPRQGCTQPRGT